MIVRARSAGVTVAIHASTAAAPTVVARGSIAEDRTRDRRDEPALAAGAPGPPAPVWARVAAANAAARELDAGDEVEPVNPEPGDVVEHFAFGLCDVLTAEGDRLRIRDVAGPRRVREVSLDMLRVMGPTEGQGGKRVFRLVRKVPGGR
jgi:hypothetical protein